MTGHTDEGGLLLDLSQVHPGDTLGAATVADVSLVGDAVSAVRVTPALLTTNEHQYVVYYGGDRLLRVAERPRTGGPWVTTVLQTQIGWDSHNYATVAVDRQGRLHVAGNMHADPLTYFRSLEPGASTTLRRVPEMVPGGQESSVTYPRFVRTRTGELGFFFRSGSSGSGDYLTYVYDEDSASWSRLTDVPLIDGEGLRSSYLDTNGPVTGPDGDFHLTWVWRDTPDAESTHTICYARSQDLRHWVGSDGEPLELPLRYGTAEVVCPVPAGRGLINNNVRLGFDTQRRPVVAYHLRDQRGRMQIYVARRDEPGWRALQVTDWDVRWDFAGAGSLDFRLEVGAPSPRPDGLSVEVRTGTGLQTLLLGPDLHLQSITDTGIPWSPLMASPGSDGLAVHAADDLLPPDGVGRRLVVWRSLPARRDTALGDDAPTPPPAPLYVLELS